VKPYCGRLFTSDELAVIQQLIRDHPAQSRNELSRRVCQALAWLMPNGRWKEMSCRVALLRMQTDGLIQLPPPRAKPVRARIRTTARSDPKHPIADPAGALAPLCLSLVHGQDQSSLWNEYIHRYHYLGYTRLPGAQLRYVVSCSRGWLALLSFSAAAWQLEDRDRFIGWSHEQRRRNLALVANNSRYLILPWVRSPNLASMVLSLVCRRLQGDWQQRYGYRPVLLETFVDAARFRGTCYKAANWTCVGRTKGRGKLGPAKKITVPIKDIWLYPLTPHFRHSLLATDH
jgi:hypothetical protein